MISKRAKITTTATIAGLGALAGVAMETNHGLPATTVATANGHEIVTKTSGAPTTTGEAAAPAGRAPIVTRSSAEAGAPASGEVDD
jgi:hypothetical protein